MSGSIVTMPTRGRSALPYPLVCLALVGFSRAQEAERDDELHAPFDAILDRAVRGERVDYLLVRDELFDDLDAYLDRLADVHPAELERDARLAFWLNLYNATMIRAVAERYVSGWTPARDEFAVFREPLVRLHDRRISLDHLEHEIVRREFDEPRVHVALVCGAVSCPPLPADPWRPEGLDERLESKLRAFLDDDRRNRVDTDRVELSKVFEWFREDFGGSDEAVRSFVGRRSDLDLSEAEVVYRDYDWSLNIAPPQEGEWRVVSSERRVRPMGDEAEPVTLREKEVVRLVSEEGQKGSVVIRLPFGRGTVAIDRKHLVPYG